MWKNKYNNFNYWTGNSIEDTTSEKSFSEETSVGQIFIDDNIDANVVQSCKVELNTGNITDRAIDDSSGNSNKGLLIGDYKIKKREKGTRMTRDSYIKVPKKINNTNGAL